MKNDLRIVNLSTYTSPTEKEVRNQEFVSYGDDNNYFQHLIHLYNGSPTNNACVTAISEMIYGKGLDATDSNRKPDQYAQMVALFNDDCVRKVAYDLKLMGQCALQVIYSKDRTKIVKLEHMPVETLRAEKCNDKGEIEAYYYHYDWSKYKRSDALTRIPAFGTSKEGLEIMYIKPYKAGFKYYSPPSNQGGLQYSELEEEISNYHINNIMNGLAPSMLINFNNGTPDPEQRELIERRIYEKFSGSNNAGKFILAFNDNAETAADIQPIQLSDAHQQYEFLSAESGRKVLVSHRVVSPMLLGIKDQTGLGNNADELKTATLLMQNTVILPFQRLLIENFDQILAYNNISLNLYFKTLQPLEFTDLDNVEDSETREEETGVKMSKEELSKEGLTDEMYDNIFDSLKGEIVTDEWELVDERDYDKENVSEEEWVSNFVKEKENLYQVASQPSGFSYLDKSNYKVRYKYAIGSRKSGGKSRRFCSDMMAASKAGVVYRLEDIDRASRNLNFKAAELPMHNNQKFSLFEHKGGIYCRHIWKEVLYVLKKNKEKSEDISDYKKTKDIPKSYKPKPRGKKKSEIAPINTPTKGAYPS